MIGFQLIDQSDAPAFLTHIQQYTPAFFLNPAQSFRQLLATVTTQGTESIPGETFGMYPAQYRFAVSDVPFYKGNVMFSIDFVDITISLENPVFSRHFSLSHSFHQDLCPTTVSDQVGHSNHLQTMPYGKFFQFGCPHHGTVFPHNFTTQAAFFEPGNTHQVDGGFGMSHTFEYPASFRLQRKHMSRTPEIGRFGIVLYTLHGRHRAFQCRNTGCRIHMVDRNGKCRTVIVGIVGHHLFQP